MLISQPAQTFIFESKQPDSIVVVSNQDGKKIYTGHGTLNDLVISPKEKLSIKGSIIANNTQIVGTKDSAMGQGAYFYVAGEAKSTNATIGQNGYLNVGENRAQEYVNGHWIKKPLIDQLTKTKAYAINTHLLPGSVLWTGVNSVTENTDNTGGILNEYYGHISGSKNTKGGREYVYDGAESTGSTFNQSQDFVGGTGRKGGIQKAVTASNHSLVTVRNHGILDGLSTTNSRIFVTNHGLISNIDSSKSAINVDVNGVASGIKATNGTVINNYNVVDGDNNLSNSTLNMNRHSVANVVNLDNSIINVNGDAQVNTINSNNKNNTISFHGNKPITLSASEINGNNNVHLSTSLNQLNSDVISVKKGIKGHFTLDFNHLSKAGRNTVGDGIEIINNNGYSHSNYQVTMPKMAIYRGILLYRLNHSNGNYYLKSSLNPVNYVNVYTPSAISSYALNNVGSLYQRQGRFMGDNKHNVWVKYQPERESINQGKLTGNTLNLGYTFFHNKNKTLDSGLMLTLGKLKFNYFNQYNNVNAFGLYNYTTIHKSKYYFDFVNGFDLAKSNINTSLSSANETFKTILFTSSIEGGYLFKYKKYNIIPQMQLIYQNLNQNGYNLVGYESDAKMNSVKQNNFIGRLGLNVNRDIQGYYLYQPFIQVSVLDQFNHNKNITTSDMGVTQFANVNRESTWLNAIVGLNVQLSSTSNLYGEAIYNDKSFNGELGYRYSF